MSGHRGWEGIRNIPIPVCIKCEYRKPNPPNKTCWHCLWQNMREQYMRDYL